MGSIPSPELWIHSIGRRLRCVLPLVLSGEATLDSNLGR